MLPRPMLRSLAVAFGLFTVGLFVGESSVPWLPGGMTVEEAHAVPGRPATPTSAAGVARRTTRRRIRRTTIYVATLPRSCSKVNTEGTVLYLCGGTYYQAHGTQYVVCNVD